MIISRSFDSKLWWERMVWSTILGRKGRIFFNCGSIFEGDMIPYDYPPQISTITCRCQWNSPPQKYRQHSEWLCYNTHLRVVLRQLGPPSFHSCNQHRWMHTSSSFLPGSVGRFHIQQPRVRSVVAGVFWVIASVVPKIQNINVWCLAIIVPLIDPSQL